MPSDLTPRPAEQLLADPPQILQVHAYFDGGRSGAQMPASLCGGAP